MKSSTLRSFLTVSSGVMLLSFLVTLPKGLVEAKLPLDVSSSGTPKIHAHMSRKLHSHIPSRKDLKVPSSADKGAGTSVHKNPVFGNRDDAPARLIVSILEAAARQSLGKP